jgi:deoxyribonuclease V
VRSFFFAPAENKITRHLGLRSVSLPHGFSPEKAHFMQDTLRKKIVIADAFHDPPRSVCGVDAAYGDEFAVGSAVLMSYEGFEEVQTAVHVTRVRFPYIPSLFALREFPPVYGALQKLPVKPDLVLVDGQGMCHPRRMGLASHLGVIADVPTIGVAKSRLFGRESIMGGTIIDGDEVVGRVLPLPGRRRFYVSVGHRVTLESAFRLSGELLSLSGGRQIVPLDSAHSIANLVLEGLV